MKLLRFDLDGPNGVSQQAMIYTFNYDNFLTHNMNDLRANNIKNPANASIAPASGTQNTSSAMPAPTTTANLTVPKPVPARWLFELAH